MNNDILQAREDRVELQDELRKIYQKPIFTHRVNMPGRIKKTPISKGIFEAVEAELQKRLKDYVLVEKQLVSAEGYVMIRVVDMPLEALKTLAVSIENEHSLGRFVDLDVYGAAGKSLSREDLGHESRRCYICSAPAHECARAQRHRLDELLEVMERAILEA